MQTQHFTPMGRGWVGWVVMRRGKRMKKKALAVSVRNKVKL